MKLCSFSVEGTARLGALDGSGAVVDLNAATAARLGARGLGAEAAARVADALTPTDLVRFAENGIVAREAAEATLAWTADEEPNVRSGPAWRHQIDHLDFLPAVPDPPMLRDFLAFEGHLRNIYPRLGREVPPEWYELPVYYKANPASVGAHGSPVVMPPYADALDFELELAALIVPGGSDIPTEDSLGHVYGYTIYNDFSARSIQGREMAVGLGPAKGKDFRGAHVLGPWIVTADEVGDPYRLAMRARVNGESWCETSSTGMHWRFEQMIAHASLGEEVRTGEVFGSGTASGGSGAEQDRSLHPGDVVELEIECLGVLRNEVVAPPATKGNEERR